ncbi:MAG: redoxin domain-containing protein [Planctomycetes bacterium]|nr:redoxin domain-containing protein [Planctomycetota bacterium]MBI3832959.1 redoxin domain-containing protein [Planctomycetota bacterium]
MTNMQDRYGVVRRLALMSAILLLNLLSSPVLAGPRKEFDALEAQLLKAHEAFRAHSGDSEQKAANGAAQPATGDPRLAILHRMDALASSSVGSSDGAFISIWTFNYSWQLDLDLANLFARFERVTRNDINDASVGDVLTAIPDTYKRSGTPQGWLTLIAKIADGATRESTRLDAMHILGQLQLKEGMTREARVTFERLGKAAAPGTDFARFAKNYLFEIDHLQIGMTAPDFAAKTLDGREIKLSSLRGKIVLLNFWATWCAPCMAKMPELQSIVARAKERNLSDRFEILGVSLDDFREVLEDAVRSRGLPGTQTWDPAGRENPIAEMYNVQNVPVWYVIDDKGVIRAKSTVNRELSESVESALKQIGR